MDGKKERYPLSVCLFGFHVLRVKLAYDDKDPSRDKSPPGSGGNGKEIFMIMDFGQSTQSKYTRRFVFILKMEFMTVVEISFPFPLLSFCFMIWLSAETVYAHFFLRFYRRQFVITWNNDCIH
jgi:hypothetical protein